MAKTRSIETKTPCPRCGRPLHMRQVAIIVDQASHVMWRDSDRFCPNGCLYTHGELQE